jgi:entry exclusion lipoprotein TrbK
MNIKNTAHLALLLTLATVVSSCSERPAPEPPKPTMPVVNDANCHPDNLKNIDARVREDFTAACLRRGTFKPSPVRRW